MTAEIVDFLTARWDQAAADAEALHDEQWTADTHIGDEYNQGIVVNDRETVATCGVERLDDAEVRARHIARHDPAHVLADIAAKRRILARVVAEDHRYCDDPWYSCPAHQSFRDATDKVGACDCSRDERVAATLRDLAAVYDQHPEYQEEWRP